MLKAPLITSKYAPAIVPPPTLERMKRLAGPNDRWAAYQNHAMDSSLLGHLQFLKIGPECTHKIPPDHMPDTSSGLGWKYLHVGWVNLKTGEITDE